MATILPFAKERAERMPREHALAGDVAGEVVIFPGVRVEYHDHTPPEPQAKTRQRRSRRNASKDVLSA